MKHKVIQFVLFTLLAGLGCSPVSKKYQRISFSEKRYEIIGDLEIKKPLPDSSFIYPGLKSYDIPLVDLTDDTAKHVIIDLPHSYT